MRIVQQPFSYQFYEAAQNLEATLRIGITTVRDAGGADLGVKQAVEDGLVPGPRMQISIIMLSQTGGHGDDWYAVGRRGLALRRHPGRPSGIVDGPDEMRRKVRRCIAPAPTSSRSRPPVASSRRATTRATPTSGRTSSRRSSRRRPRRASSSWPTPRAPTASRTPIRAGIRSIDHGIFLDDEAIELMMERGTWFVPTLVAPQGVLDAAAAGAAAAGDRSTKARMVVDVHRAAFRQAVEAGVRIAMGTDSGVTPHGRNLRELALMVEGGMTPAAALEATTRSAAQLMGVDDELGTIEPGKLADLVVVSGDPYEFGTLGERVEQVWKAGGPPGPRPSHLSVLSSRRARRSSSSGPRR